MMDVAKSKTFKHFTILDQARRQDSVTGGGQK